MKEVIEELEREHDHIEHEIASLRAFQDSPEYRQRLVDFLNFVKAHHHHEETDLFPYLATQTWLGEGGPKCTFFMGMRLEFAPLEPIRSALKEMQTQYPSYSNDPIVNPDWLQPSSPLSIPMEEHALGGHLQKALLFLLSEAPEEFSSAQGLGTKLVTTCLNLVEMHLRKEKECLFVLCKSKLT